MSVILPPDLRQAQTAIWLDQQLFPTKPIYTTGQVLTIRGSLRFDLFELALRETVAESPWLQLPPRTAAIAFDLPLLDFRDRKDPSVAARQWMRTRCVVRSRWTVPRYFSLHSCGSAMISPCGSKSGTTSSLMRPAGVSSVLAPPPATVRCVLTSLYSKSTPQPPTNCWKMNDAMPLLATTRWIAFIGRSASQNGLVRCLTVTGKTRNAGNPAGQLGSHSRSSAPTSPNWRAPLAH